MRAERIKITNARFRQISSRSLFDDDSYFLKINYKKILLYSLELAMQLNPDHESTRVWLLRRS